MRIPQFRMHWQRLRAAIARPPTITVHGLQWYCPTPLCVWRAHTLLTKEPETIRWIDRIPKGSVLWDIGANIGCYSLYAAQRGIRVVAFEPHPANYGVLATNVSLNQLKRNIILVPLPLSNTPHQMCEFALNSCEPGTAMHTINREPLQTSYVRLLTTTIDEMEKTVAAPDYIKLDVDGNERLILEGGREVLKTVKGMIIEVENDAWLRYVESLGFTLKSVERSPMFDGTKYAHYRNGVFARC